MSQSTIDESKIDSKSLSHRHNAGDIWWAVSCPASHTVIYPCNGAEGPPALPPAAWASWAPQASTCPSSRDTLLWPPGTCSSWSSSVQASITHWEHTLIVPYASTTSTRDTHLVPLQNSEPLHFWQCLSCNLTDSTSWWWWSALDDTHDSSSLVPLVEASWDTTYCKHTWNKKECYWRFLLFVLADKYLPM